MTDYLKTTLNLVHSENPDYTDAKISGIVGELSLTPNVVHKLSLNTDSGGDTVVISTHMSSCQLAVFRNNSTQTVSVTGAFASGAFNVTIAAGGFFVTTDLNPATNVVASSTSGNARVDLYFAGTK